MKLLVTGGSGLVGKGMQAIQHDAYFNHHQFVFVSSSDYDLLDINQTLQMMLDHKPDCVIHLAANVGGLFKNMNQKVEMFEHNIMMNMNVLQSCFNTGVTKFIGMLSTCIFPDQTHYPINETMLHDGAPHASNDSYAYAKRMLQVQCQAYNEQHGTSYKCVIPTNVYGEHDNYNLQNAHVIPALIHRCYLARQKDEDFVVRGTGTPLRQFIYSRDLAAGVLNVLDVLHDIDEQTVIISGGEETEKSIKDISYKIAGLFDHSHRLKFDDSYSDGQYKKTADNTLFQTLAPQFEFTPIDVGLERAVNWFVDVYPHCRV